MVKNALRRCLGIYHTSGINEHIFGTQMTTNNAKKVRRTSDHRAFHELHVLYYIQHEDGYAILSRVLQ